MSERELTPQEQKALLELARGTIAGLVGAGGREPDPAGLPGPEVDRGAFVTLHKRGQLRGCIGNFASQGPLTNTIR